MKVALMHELLTMKGGAERVLRVFADMFPDAPIYTFLYDEKKLGDWFPKNRVKTPRHWLLSSGLSFNHHLYLPAFPKAAESFDFSEFDLVISSSSAFAHGIKTSGKTKHICYVHAPARYLWDRTHEVQKNAGIAGLYLAPLFHRLRLWDVLAAERGDMLIAPSKEVQRRIQLYWNRESTVIYPPLSDRYTLHVKTFERANVQRSNEPKGRELPNYFLIVSTLARYKRIDLAIQACNITGKHLKIVGDGPDMQRLKGLAGPAIEFYGHRDGDELMDLYTDAQATIFPGHEDLGLVPLESLACGTPVIAYRGGGALETVEEGVTGEFFDEPTGESLAKTLDSFDHKKYSTEKCMQSVQKLSRSEFEQQIYTAIERLGLHKS